MRDELANGLIPAHAGSTCVPRWRADPHWAHPRSRGEHSPPRWARSVGPGSSPLTRGAPRFGGVEAASAGLIPAHAGSTHLPQVTPPQPRAHPRSRGEHASSSERARTSSGSSPLTRGARRTHARHLGRTRLIPAHAGSTLPDLWKEPMPIH